MAIKRKNKGFYPTIRRQIVSDEASNTDTHYNVMYEVTEIKKLDSLLGGPPEPMNTLFYMVKGTLQM